MRFDKGEALITALILGAIVLTGYYIVRWEKKERPTSNSSPILASSSSSVLTCRKHERTALLIQNSGYGALPPVKVGDYSDSCECINAGEQWINQDPSRRSISCIPIR